MRNNLSEIGEIQELVHGARRILLITHVAPDGDAIGSLLSMGRMLKAQGKEITLACEDAIPDTYDWLQGSADIVRSGEGLFDLVVSLDCSDRRRMGKVFHDDLVSLPLINIDHHITNTRFGTVNLVDPASVSTTQLVYTLARALGWEVTESVAECLLTGLVTDTRSFRTANVDAAAVKTALQLIESGASLGMVARQALDQRPLSSLQLWAQAINLLQVEDGILWTVITREMRQKWRMGDDGFSGLANFLSGVREAEVVLVFTERDDGTVDVGMRSVPGYDVAQIAVGLGGGGHPQAAGCTLTGDLSEVQDRVLAQVRSGIADQRAGKA